MIRPGDHASTDAAAARTGRARHFGADTGDKLILQIMFMNLVNGHITVGKLRRSRPAAVSKLASVSALLLRPFTLYSRSVAVTPMAAIRR